MEERLEKTILNIEKVILGKRSVVERILVGILAEGHILLEDVPGTGKTVLARALAKSMDLAFQRIQFTPDLLPSDVTGSTVFDRRTGTFTFRPGPVFSEILLADEINRAAPRTQSALLEAMAEKTVSVDGTTHRLPAPFVVIATENPVEMEGTFPLPEAQLDRFLLKLSVGYPDAADEVDVLRIHGHRDPLATLEPVLSKADLLALVERAKGVLVQDDLFVYAAALARATRTHPDVVVGASPRGSLSLLRAAKALALVRGRDHLLPDDLKDIAPDALSHRLLLTSDALIRGQDPRRVVLDVMASVAAPVEDPR